GGDARRFGVERGGPDARRDRGPTWTLPRIDGDHARRPNGGLYGGGAARDAPNAPSGLSPSPARSRECGDTDRPRLRGGRFVRALGGREVARVPGTDRAAVDPLPDPEGARRWSHSAARAL